MLEESTPLAPRGIHQRLARPSLPLELEDKLPEAEATDLDLLEVLELTATDFYKK